MREAAIKFELELVARDPDEDMVEDRLGDFTVWLLENQAMIASLYADENGLDEERYELRVGVS